MKSSRKTEKKGSIMAKKSDTKTPARKESPPARTTRLDPFDPGRLSEWFDRWPDVFARRWPEGFPAVAPFAQQGFRMEQFTDEDGTLVVRGELPGLDPDSDVTIVVEGDLLKISGRREERSEDTTDDTYWTEFHYGSFSRSVGLPSGARTDDIKASYTDGILEVRVPIDAEASEATKIPIAKAN